MRGHRQDPWLTRLAERWYPAHTFGAKDLPDAGDLAAHKRERGITVAVAIPALDEEATIAEICSTIRRDLIDGVPLVDDLVVIEGGSSDATARVARVAGARVVGVADALPRVPPVRGKGESLWRSLAVCSSDVICWIDADIRNFGSHFVSRLVAPLILDQRIAFSKAFYRRPISSDGELRPSGGGRVTELLARPMLNALFPELGGFLQPLSGEYAGRRDVLTQIPFFSGYSVEVGLLIDLLHAVGLDAMVQVDLEERVHRNRPLDELGPMAYAIARAIMMRAEQRGRLRAAHDYLAPPLMQPGTDGPEPRDVREMERPPLESLAPRPAALPV